MSKKLMALMLVMVMALSFVSCAKSKEDVRGEIETKPAASDTQTPSQEEKEPEFSLGVSTENTYKNEFIGIQCKLDDNWKFNSDEEIKAINEQAMDLVGKDYSEAIKSADTVTDMYAVKSNETDTINVVLERLSGLKGTATEDDYAKASISQVKGAFESMGATVKSCETSELEFAGQTHKTVTLETEFNGSSMYETLVIIKCPGYMALVTACTWNENTTVDILNNFTAL